MSTQGPAPLLPSSTAIVFPGANGPDTAHDFTAGYSDAGCAGSGSAAGKGAWAGYSAGNLKLADAYVVSGLSAPSTNLGQLTTAFIQQANELAAAAVKHQVFDQGAAAGALGILPIVGAISRVAGFCGQSSGQVEASAAAIHSLAAAIDQYVSAAPSAQAADHGASGSTPGDTPGLATRAAARLASLPVPVLVVGGLALAGLLLYLLPSAEE